MSNSLRGIHRGNEIRVHGARISRRRQCLSERPSAMATVTVETAAEFERREGEGWGSVDSGRVGSGRVVLARGLNKK